MTGFHEIRFPDNIAYGATGGPEFAATVVVMASRSAAFAARPASGMVHAADRLIVALDLGDKVSCYKIGYHLQLISGYDNLVDRLVDQLGKDVLLDTKVCDIEETVRAAVRGSVKRRANFLTVHGND